LRGFDIIQVKSAKANGVSRSTGGGAAGAAAGVCAAACGSAASVSGGAGARVGAGVGVAPSLVSVFGAGVVAWASMVFAGLPESESAVFTASFWIVVGGAGLAEVCVVVV